MPTDSSHRVIKSEKVLLLFSCFDQMLSMLVGKDNVHKSLDEFEIRPDPTKDYGFSHP